MELLCGTMEKHKSTDKNTGDTKGTNEKRTYSFKWWIKLEGGRYIIIPSTEERECGLLESAAIEKCKLRNV